MKKGPRCTMYRQTGLMGQGGRKVKKWGFRSQVIRISTVPKNARQESSGREHTDRVGGDATGVAPREDGGNAAGVAPWEDSGNAAGVTPREDGGDAAGVAPREGGGNGAGVAPWEEGGNAAGDTSRSVPRNQREHPHHPSGLRG